MMDIRLLKLATYTVYLGGQNIFWKLFQSGTISWRCAASRWSKGALADDGCIFYFPDDDCQYGGWRILKLDPNNDGSPSLVGEEIHDGYQAADFSDGYFYGISCGQVIKCKLKDFSLSQKDNDLDDYDCFSGTTFGDDWNISGRYLGQILKVDTANNDFQIIRSEIK